MKYRRWAPGGGARLWRLAVVVSIVAAFVALPAIASAGIEGGCTGSVDIQGTTYGPDNDTTSNPIVVPIDEEGVVANWQGAVPFENKNHNGELGIVVGPWTIQIADWGDPNDEDTRDSSGTYSVEEFKEQFPVPDALIPRGIYELSGSHTASGGSCTGTLMVKLEGSSVFGIASALGAGITLITMIGAGFGRNP